MSLQKSLHSIQSVSYENIPKYCQALCPFWSLIFDLKNMDKDWHLSPFHPQTTRKLFLCQMKAMAKIRLLLWWCDIDFALIIRYQPFCFLWLYIRISINSLLAYCFFLLVFLSFSPSVCLSFLLTVCLSKSSVKLLI